MPTSAHGLRVMHGTVLVLGMMLSTDVLKTGSTVIAHIGRDWFLPLGVLGALVSLIGALNYAEMAAAFPDRGGEYSFIRRVWGERIGAMYAWSRFAIVHTGWIALMAHLAADYASRIYPLDHGGRLAFAAATVTVLGILNMIHIRLISRLQAMLISLVAAGFLIVTLAGMVVPPVVSASPTAHGSTWSDVSIAFTYVFLTFGGWTDAATLSSEVRSRRYGMLVVIVGAIGSLCAICLALNWAMLRGLGEAAFARSTAPAADLAGKAFGASGVVLVVAIVVISAIASINSMIMVGARITVAAAQDAPVLRRFGLWNATRGTSLHAVAVVTGLALVLTVLAGLAPSGFAAMVSYMTPVYWLFMIAGMGAAIRLRYLHPDQPRPVRTPFFPLLPLTFLFVAAGMFVASLASLGIGALAGAAVLAGGAALDQFLRERECSGGKQSA